jgi:hypothetical protein
MDDTAVGIPTVGTKPAGRPAWICISFSEASCLMMNPEIPCARSAARLVSSHHTKLILVLLANQPLVWRRIANTRYNLTLFSVFACVGAVLRLYVRACVRCHDLL